MPLSIDQQNGYELALSWFASKPDSPFVLRGYAGTGKSFLAAQICKGLPASAKIALCAPTHKAKHVLATFAAANRLSVHVSTLHSLLHAIPGDYDNHEKQGLESNDYSQSPHYSDFDLVVIDEASMIGGELLDWVIAQKIPTLFMGDPAQLPPVEDDEPLSPVFSLPIGAELKEVMRYEGKIANLATRLRQQIDAQFLPRIESGGNIAKLKPAEWMDELTRHVKLSLENNDVHYVRAMAWTNRRVSELNQCLRDRIFDCPDPFFAGERLMAKDLIIKRGWDAEKETVDILMHSCSECVVGNIRDAVIQLGDLRLDGIGLTLFSESGKPFEIEVLDHFNRSDWARAEDFFAELRREILEMPLAQRHRQWTYFYRTLESINACWRGRLMQRLQPALAITIHQSQGSTFKNAFVDLPNIYGCRIPKLRNQLAYVAFTRASENLIIGSKY